MPGSPGSAVATPGSAARRRSTTASVRKIGRCYRGRFAPVGSGDASGEWHGRWEPCSSCWPSLRRRRTRPAPPRPARATPPHVQRLDLTVAGVTAYGTLRPPAQHDRAGSWCSATATPYNLGRLAQPPRRRRHPRRPRRRGHELPRAQRPSPARDDEFERSRGFPVKAGGEDLVAAAQHLERVCGGFDRRILLGVSMGGNTSGLGAPTRSAKTDAGRPLRDYWVGVEGVKNLTETYTEARAAGATRAARRTSRREAGGTLEQPAGRLRGAHAGQPRGPTSPAPGLGASSSSTGPTTASCPTTRPRSSSGPHAPRGRIPTDFYTATRKRPGDQADDTRVAPDRRPGPRVGVRARHMSSTRGSTASPRSPAATARRPAIATSPSTGPRRRGSRPTRARPRAAARRAPASTGRRGPAAARRAAAPIARRPALSLRAVRSRGRLVVRGRARERGCKSGVRRVRVAVARVGAARRRCRFVTRPRTGRLSRPRSCRRARIFLRPRGTRRFRLVLRGLPAGRYRIAAVATDRAGNRGRATLLRVAARARRAA